MDSRKIRQQFDNLQEIAKLGYLEIDAERTMIHCTAQLLDIWGVDNTKVDTSFTCFINTLHEDDREQFQAAFSASLETDKPFELEYRIITPSGFIKMIDQKGIIVRDEKGKAIKLESSVQDITERKITERALIESEEKYRDIFNLSPLPQLVFSLETYRILDINTAAIDHFEFTRKDFLDQPLYNLFDTAGFQKIDTILKAEIAGRRIYFGQTAMFKRDRMPIDAELYGHSITYSGIPCVLMTINDITENVAAQRELLKANQRLETAQQIANLGYWQKNFITNETFWSPQMFRIFDYEIGETNPGFTAALIKIPPAEHRIFTELVDNARAQGGQFHIEHHVHCNDGSVKTVVGKGNYIFDDKGQAIYGAGTVQDITAIKKMEEKLVESAKELELIYNNVSDSIFLLSVEEGKQFIFRSVNNSFLQTTGLKKENVIGASINDIIPAASYERLFEKYRQAITQKNPVQWEEQSDFPAGRVSGIVTLIPLMNEEQVCTGLLGSVHDISQLKFTEEALKELNQKLEKRAEELAESNAELERFAYVASHDLQEPLRMVSSFLQLLQNRYKDELDADGQRYIHYAVDGANRMKQLILDLLEYSRLDKLLVREDQTDLNLVVKEVVQDLRSKIKQVNADIDAQNLPVIPNSSRSQLLQLMQNLIANAIKYNDKPQPYIRIYAEEHPEVFLVKVSDNGIGIENRFHEKVFVLFQRLHNQSEYSGTGIGLSICKKIVERHKGRIWVESNEEAGCTFCFTMPK